MTRIEELQAMYRQFILDRIGVDVTHQSKKVEKICLTRN